MEPKFEVAPSRNRIAAPFPHDHDALALAGPVNREPTIAAVAESRSR
ncbi:MAG TPA: hypothetical protein VHX61_11860 [Rhizomicrobium sp.]|jgi:hypothetical protein|nr:hypothetical protein [Rhizomicrobium sp.]